ncbi:undecaprenyl-diphosphatase [Bacillus aquiflavi]|uniref:undecaprenyl-diphosphatase n=1 Tax=Bacillus aquiflavi TaxID=2672567 RepID=UPI001CA8AAA1|nr:undecaprenyl-diphosphatase [Bacillus aquiflavi]UAC49717.1 undecaprenyl-diphosphatase [Bacillus aquiflavi]
MSVSQINIDVFRMINNLGNQSSFLNPIAIFFAEYMLYILALGMVIYWFTRTKQNRMMIIQAVIAFILAEIAGKISGLFYSHHQPFADLPNVNQLIDHAIDNSFPSDHTILFFSICFSIWLVRKKEGWLWLIIACFVGISRILVGVHYPIDIVFGGLFGITSAILSYWMTPKLTFLKNLLHAYEKVEDFFLPAKYKSHSKDKYKNF